MNLTIKLAIGDDVFRVEGSFTPGRPAPTCSNPSSPRYSDPGDPAEFEPEVAYRVDGGNVTIDEMARLYRPSREPWAAREALNCTLLEMAVAEYWRLRAGQEA